MISLPRLDWLAPYFDFTPHEVEQLAISEHARGCDERERHGWRFGKPRDEVQKFHPDLVKWPDLSEISRNFTLSSCRRIPLLMRARNYVSTHGTGG